MKPRRHQSRRALLSGLGTFTVLQIAAALLVTRWMPWLRQPDYGHKVQRLEALQARHPRRSLTVVALGTSRTSAAVDGQLAESLLEQALGQPVTVANFGLAGGKPFTHLLALRRLLADGHRPDFLLLEVFPVTLHRTFPLDDTSEEYVSTVSLRRSELSYLARYARNRKVRQLEWGLQWLSPVYTYRQNLLNCVLPEWQPLAQRPVQLGGDAWGWGGTTRLELISPSALAQALARTRKLYYAAAHELEPGGESLELFTTLLGLCRREQIPTALVVMPEGPTFRSWYGPGRLEHCRTVLDGLSHRFGIPVIDALLWVEDDNEFYDSHHLLEGGAREYTRRLFGEALPPLLRHYSGANGINHVATRKQD